MEGINLGPITQPKGIPINMNPTPQPKIVAPSNNPPAPKVEAPETPYNNLNKAMGVAKAIREHETGGVAKIGASGETKSMYQFLPATWKGYAKEVLGDENAPLNNENENKVAVKKIQGWLNKGMTIDQIASMWNHGSPDYQGVVGMHTNEDGTQVAYDVPKYVDNVTNIYNSKYSNDNFSDNIDKVRNKGLSDTDILNSITQKNKSYATMYQQLKAKGLNDTDALNTMALSYSGKMPTSQSKAPVITPEAPKKSLLDVLNSEFTGFGKSFVNTALNMAAPIYDLPTNIAKLATGKDIYKPLGQTKFSQEEATAREGEKIGNTIGDVSQFFVPGEASLKVGNAAEKLAMNAPKIIQKGAKLVGRAGTEALANAAITTLQGHPEQAGSTALVAGALPVIGSAAGLLKKATGSISSRLINSLIKPANKAFDYGKNPGEAIAKEGIVAKSVQELIPKIDSKLKEIGSTMDAIFNAPQNINKRVDVSNILDTIEKQLKDIKPVGDTNIRAIDRLNNLKQQITDYVTQKGYDLKNLTLSQARDLKGTIGGAREWVEKKDDDIVNQAINKMYGGIKEKINIQVPEVKEYNEAYANFLSAKNSAENRALQIQRNNILGLVAGAGATGGIGLGIYNYMQGNSDAGNRMLLAGLGSAALSKISGSTFLKTLIASALSKDPIQIIGKMDKDFPAISSTIKRIFGGKGEKINDYLKSTNPEWIKIQKALKNEPLLLGPGKTKIPTVENPIYTNYTGIEKQSPNIGNINSIDLRTKNIKDQIKNAKKSLEDEIKNTNDEIYNIKNKISKSKNLKDKNILNEDLKDTQNKRKNMVDRLNTQYSVLDLQKKAINK